MREKWIFPFLLFLLFCSCAEEKKKPIFHSTQQSWKADSVAMNDDFALEGDIVSIPFSEKKGIKYVDVSVNGMSVKMVFDTGCSLSLISVAEAQYLYSKGRLTEADFLGVVPTEIADGSIVKNMVVNLKEVVIGDKLICKNVVATVSENPDAPLLLGSDILDRAASYTIDNENKNINFKLK